MAIGTNVLIIPFCWGSLHMPGVDIPLITEGFGVNNPSAKMVSWDVATANATTFWMDVNWVAGELCCFNKSLIIRQPLVGRNSPHLLPGLGVKEMGPGSSLWMEWAQLLWGVEMRKGKKFQPPFFEHRLMDKGKVDPSEKYNCILQMGTCTIELPEDKVLTVYDEFTINGHSNVSGVELTYPGDLTYLPRHHIKLDPPSNLQSNVSSRGCIFSWSPPIEELYMSLSYELALRQHGEAWERARHKDRITGVTVATIEAFEFVPNLLYEARLRCRLGSREAGESLDDEEEDFDYRSQWSEWSPVLQFPSPISLDVSSPPQGGPISMIIIFSIFLFLISLPYILFKLFPRVKKTFYQNVPSPEAFFRPLYTVHNGNFQMWARSDLLGPQLRRPGAMDRRVLTRDELLGLMFGESISHLSCFPMKSKRVDIMEEEDPCKPRGPHEESTQQDSDSKYLSAEELENWRLPGVTIDGHGDDDDAQGYPDFPGASQSSSLATRCPHISLKQEDQTPESCSPINSDYCTVSGSEMPQALPLAGELQGPLANMDQ
ncbi:interleukin-9 receptor-like [Gracilinanus agilis]|uniref:interleukin-9 receptor-like n=1 Tax=Gracilinanus agilis TaxID=191870 RepID=UPI001CFE1A07|nr:interleukin-9 receptor-like [Gracilinanus agilis]